VAAQIPVTNSGQSRKKSNQFQWETSKNKRLNRERNMKIGRPSSFMQPASFDEFNNRIA
jgi:hypothetical protein